MGYARGMGYEGDRVRVTRCSRDYCIRVKRVMEAGRQGSRQAGRQGEKERGRERKKEGERETARERERERVDEGHRNALSSCGSPV